MPLSGEVVPLGAIGVAGNRYQSFLFEFFDIVVHHGTGQVRMPSDGMLTAFRRIMDGKEHRKPPEFFCWGQIMSIKWFNHYSVIFPLVDTVRLLTG